MNIILLLELAKTIPEKKDTEQKFKNFCKRYNMSNYQAIWLLMNIADEMGLTIEGMNNIRKAIDALTVVEYEQLMKILQEIKEGLELLNESLEIMSGLITLKNEKDL